MYVVSANVACGLRVDCTTNNATTWPPAGRSPAILTRSPNLSGHFVPIPLQLEPIPVPPIAFVPQAFAGLDRRDQLVHVFGTGAFDFHLHSGADALAGAIRAVTATRACVLNAARFSLPARRYPLARSRHRWSLSPSSSYVPAPLSAYMIRLDDLSAFITFARPYFLIFCASLATYYFAMLSLLCPSKSVGSNVLVKQKNSSHNN